MTLAEIRTYIRLQIQEETEAQLTNADIDKYIQFAVIRFLNKTKVGLKQIDFTVDNTKVGETALAEVFAITCVADLTATTGSIGGQFFNMFDTDGNTYYVWYDVANGSTDPNPGGVSIEVDIIANELVNDVATKTQLAIDAVVDSAGVKVFGASVSNAIVTVTLQKKGFITNDAVNFDVNNGTTALAISITTNGIDDSFDVGFRVIKERGVIFVPDSSGTTSQNSLETTRREHMLRISFDDFRRFDADQLENNFFFYLEVKPSVTSKLFISSNLEAGTIKTEFVVGATAATTQTIIEDGTLPEEYHEAIANYGISLGFKRDREFVLASTYLQLYLLEEKEAKQEAEERESRSVTWDFSTTNTNPHREADIEAFQDLVEP